MAAWLRWVLNHLGAWRRRPPSVGVREPRRPKPTLPAGGVALAEPRTGVKRRIRLGNRRDDDR
jgi:hypothetical protein